MKKILAVLLLAGALGGCALMPGWLQTGSAGGGWGSKTVDFKEDPATLLARDGTLCTVTVSKYRNVKLGDRVWCHWRTRGDGSPVPVEGRAPDQATGSRRGFAR